MAIVKTSPKGQVVIPKDIRRKFNVVAGKLINVFEKDGHIILEPLPDDPIDAACGMLKDGPSLTKALLKSRKEDRKLEN
ncbi:MAG: AbrB/MazE/SpoVT family DNA-binding domain-containing protein [Nitrospinota bacterium]|nr:AbrB/MazE/SpoVT family DNA-binding domain-containing protein [Nitrospinota bacterium]